MIELNKAIHILSCSVVSAPGGRENRVYTVETITVTLIMYMSKFTYLISWRKLEQEIICGSRSTSSNMDRATTNYEYL